MLIYNVGQIKKNMGKIEVKNVVVKYLDGSDDIGF